MSARVARRYRHHRRQSLLPAAAAFLFLFTEHAFACPDLEPVGFMLQGPAIVAPGESLTRRLSVFVHNAGTDSAATFGVAFYISTDDVITTSDQVLTGGADFRPPLVPGGLDPVRRIGDLTVPAGWPAGPAFLGVVVDISGTVAECSEANNTVSFPVIVRAPQNAARTVPTGYGTIAAAVAAATEGDTIRILAGEYDESFTADKGLVFVGAGWDSTIIRTSTSNDFIMNVPDGVSVALRDIQFESSLAEPYYVSRGVRGTGATIGATRCRFQNIPNFSLQAEDGAVAVDSCEFIAWQGAVDVGVDAGNSAFWISDSYGGTTFDHVFDARVNAVGVVESCTADGSAIYWANGIRIRDFGTVALVRNNVVNGQHNGSETWIQTVGGIVAFGVGFVEIEHNQVHGFTHGMTFTAGTKARVHHNTISGNLLAGVDCADAPLADLGGGAQFSPGLNVIQNNGPWSVRHRGSPDLYARYNAWDSTDSAAVDATMYDDEENPLFADVIFMKAGFYLPSGWSVQIITDLGFLLKFDSVIDPGVVAVYPFPVGPPPPRPLAPYPLGAAPVFFEIATSAIHLGPIELGYRYDERMLPGPELAMTLWHHDGSEWRNVTTSWEPQNDMIVGATMSLSPFLAGTLDFLCGDANASGAVSSADIIFLVNHVFKGGPVPLPVPASGDANSDDKLTSADIIGLVNYVFKSGSPPQCR